MEIRSRHAGVLGDGDGDDVVGIKREDAVGPDSRGERQDVVSSMSQSGTFRTCRDSLTMSAHRAKADIPPQGRDFRF